MTKTSLAAAYIYDADLREAANAAGRNYWYEYIREILDRLGLTAAPISRHALTDSALAKMALLFVGDLTAAQVAPEAAAALDRWVQAGGVLIGFGSEGLDELFGVRFRSLMPQHGDEFSIAGYFAFSDHPLTAGIHSVLHPEQKLIILSPIRSVWPTESVELARLYSFFGADTGCAAITMREYGQGRAFYFGFNVPQTMWTLHQGRPLTADYDGDGYYRTSDKRVIGTNEPEVAYSDELLFLLQNMVATQSWPLLHQLPPVHNEGPGADPGSRITDPASTLPAASVPDALFFWGGDDEAAAGTQVWASDWMKSRGLPYHINLMPLRGAFHLSVEEFQHIKANGHEPSLHYNFIDDFAHPNAFTETDLQAQAELYRRTYGEDPICSVNHWCCWIGWAEPAKWMAAQGGKADNCHIHRGSPPLNPTNMLGFSFGTAFPYYFYDDWRGGNQKIDFLEEPITGYEVGYLAGETRFDVLHKTIDTAVRYHLTMNLFYHPVNVYHQEACRQAIDEVLRYLEEQGHTAVHVGNDELWRWWTARSAGQITDVTVEGNTLTCTATCDYPRGFIVKVPLGTATAALATCDGLPATVHLDERFGQQWAYMVVPPGRHEIHIRWGGTP